MMRPLQLAPISGRRSRSPDVARWIATSLAVHAIVLLPSLLGGGTHLRDDDQPIEKLIFLAPLLPRRLPPGDEMQEQDGVSGVPIHFATLSESVVGVGSVPGVVIGRSQGIGATPAVKTEIDVAAAPTEEPPKTGDEHVYQAVDVDREVQREATASAPLYPEQLRTTNVQGGATAEFIVDTLGLVEEGTFHIVGATHPLFAAAVRDAVPGMRFKPAVRAGHTVRQQVIQSFQFVLAAPTPELSGKPATKGDSSKVP